MRLPLNKLMILADVISLFTILAFTVLAIVCRGADEITDAPRSEEFCSGWVTSAGEVLSLDQIPNGDIALTHDLTGISIENRQLCMKSVDTYITVSFDGEQTYRYAPEYCSLLGRSYGMYIHTISIPPGAQTVELALHPCYPDTAAYLRQAQITSAADFKGELYRNGLPGFAV